MKKNRSAVWGVTAMVLVPLFLLIGCYEANVDSLLVEYEQLVDEGIAMTKNAGNDPFKALAKIAKFQEKLNDLSERLENCADDMTEEQLAEFLRITMKMATIGY